MNTEENKRYAFIEPEVSCDIQLMSMAKKLGKKMHVEVVDASNFCEKRDQIVVVNLNVYTSEGFLESLSKPGRADHIKHLFIEQFGHPIPKDLSSQFEIIPIDLDYTTEIPENICLDEIAMDIADDIRNECTKLKQREVKKKIKTLTDISISKPKKVMSDIRKFLIKKKLEKYGTLDEVFQLLQH